MHYTGSKLPTSIHTMDGTDVNTSPLGRLSAHVNRRARTAGYDLDNRRSGAQQKLAADAGMTTTAVSRLLSGRQMPAARYLWGLAQALRLEGETPEESYAQLLHEADMIPTEEVAQERRRSLPSTPLTPDDVADRWGITNPKDREMIRAMYAALANPQPTAEEHDDGSAQAQ